MLGKRMNVNYIGHTPQEAELPIEVKFKEFIELHKKIPFINSSGNGSLEKEALFQSDPFISYM